MAEPYLERLEMVVREAGLAESIQIRLECKDFFAAPRFTRMG